MRGDKKITILELFSGIGGFTKGFEETGYEIENHYFSEIDKHAIANYKYNFKNAEYIGSVTNVSGSSIKRPNIITFGSPCQDFSLAGKRKGMDGERSSLILHAIRLIRECRPDVFIWENVKGTFSSNAGADFWAIIQAFANIGGYRIEWQLLNTAWFLPQNRERIYLVGHLAGGSEAGVFPIGEPGKLYYEGEQEKSGKLASTLNANDFKSWVGNFVHQINPSKESGGKQPYQQNRIYDKEGIAPTIDRGAGRWQIGAMRGRNPENPSDRTTGAPTEQRLELNENGTTNTLTSVQKDNLVVDHTNIRRLTEIECERLQGFPDDWTKYGDYDGVVKEIAKTQRYKMLGNAVTVDVVKAVAARLTLTALPGCGGKF
jgi:DNA (cytosine-5)-methyltransferase 1